MMLKNIGILGALAAGAMLALAAFAPAASAEGGTGDVRLRGEGTLEANGDGIAAVRGRIEATVSARGGILLVKDVAGDAGVEVNGHGDMTTWNGFDVYFGAGEASISGSDVAFVVVGNNVELSVTGKGWAYLKGKGVFYVNDRGPFRWTFDGRFAPVDGAVDPPPEAPAS